MKNDKTYMVTLEPKMEGTNKVLAIEVEEYSFEAAQAFIGGYIEKVNTIVEDHVMLIDEDGLRKELMINPIATLAYQSLTEDESSVIVGKVVVCKQNGSEFEGFTIDEAYSQKFGMINGFEEYKAYKAKEHFFEFLSDMLSMAEEDEQTEKFMKQ